MTNINLKTINIRNFLSIGNNTQSIDLCKDPLTLVLGTNNDSGGRNGTGKTSIIQAISYGLYGKPLTKIKLTNLVNNVNKKNMVVTIEFERDGICYRIERGQKPAFMKFFVDSNEQADDEAQGENRKTQERIDALIGMSHSLFRHIIALNTFTDPFLKMTVGDQRAVIEELLGVTQISDRAETLKSLIASTKESMREQEAIIRTTVEANSRIEKTVSNTERQFAAWETTKATTISNIENQIVALEQVNFDEEIALFEKLDLYITQDREMAHNLDAARRDQSRALQDLTEAKRRYDRAIGAGVAAGRSVSLLPDLNRKRKALIGNNQKIQKFEVELASVQADRDNAESSDCVCCGQPLVGTNHLATVISNLTRQVASSESDLLRERRENAVILADIADLERDIISAQADEAFAATEKETEANALKTEVAMLTTLVSAKEEEVSDAQSARTALGARPEPAFSSRDDLYSAKQASETLVREYEIELEKKNPYGEQIRALRSTMTAVSYDGLNDLDNLYKHQDFLLKLLVSKDSFIRKRIVDQNIHFMNVRLEYYLGKLGLPHSVKFQSDLSVDITLLGIDMDFEQLSRGEMNRVILATSWSFRDVWESLNFPINLLVVDELVDNGTDTLGAEMALNILKSMGRANKNVFLISHREDFVSRIDTIKTITKSDGFTVFG